MSNHIKDKTLSQKTFEEQAYRKFERSFSNQSPHRRSYDIPFELKWNRIE